MYTAEQWERAEERAADETATRRLAYAQALIADNERMKDVLYQRMACHGEAADALCKRVAHMLVMGVHPYGLLASIAAEEAADEVPDVDPETMMEDE